MKLSRDYFVDPAAMVIYVLEHMEDVVDGETVKGTTSYVFGLAPLSHTDPPSLLLHPHPCISLGAFRTINTALWIKLDPTQELLNAVEDAIKKYEPHAVRIVTDIPRVAGARQVIGPQGLIKP